MADDSTLATRREAIWEIHSRAGKMMVGAFVLSFIGVMVSHLVGSQLLGALSFVSIVPAAAACIVWARIKTAEARRIT